MARHAWLLVAWRHKDWLFRYRNAVRLAESFPEARLEKVPDAHAFVPEDNPDRLVELMHDFLGPSAQRAATSAL